jgi:hypothetical protein
LPHFQKRVQRYGDISVPPNLFALFIAFHTMRISACRAFIRAPKQRSGAYFAMMR